MHTFLNYLDLILISGALGYAIVFLPTFIFKKLGWKKPAISLSISGVLFVMMFFTGAGNDFRSNIVIFGDKSSAWDSDSKNIVSFQCVAYAGGLNNEKINKELVQCCQKALTSKYTKKEYFNEKTTDEAFLFALKALESCK